MSNSHGGDVKKKFTPVGHDRQLSDAQYAGNVVLVELMDGDQAVGKVLRRCRYTLTIDDGRENGDLIIFKHAIASIRITPIVD